MPCRKLCTALLLTASVTLAQSRPSDLTGRWHLIEPTAAERALDTLAVDAPDQLLITQTAIALVVEHPSKPGTHPEAGTFRFGTRGSGRETWDVSFIGTQLMISHSIRDGAAQGSMWRLEAPDRLVIEFSEERAGGRPKIATRVYAAATAATTPPRGGAP